MTIRLALAVVLLLSCASTLIAQQETSDGAFWDWLVGQSNEIDFDQYTPHRAISFYLTIARGCLAMDQAERAHEYLQRAMKTDELDEHGTHHFTFYGDLTAAMKTASECEDRDVQNRARIGIARFLCETGQLDAARQFADRVFYDIKEDGAGELPSPYQHLAKLYGMLQDQSRLEELFKQLDTCSRKADCIIDSSGLGMG